MQQHILTFSKRPLIIVAFFCILLGALTAVPARPGAWGRGLEKVERLTEEQAIEYIQNFRYQRLRGGYAFDLNIKHLPRRGETSNYRATLEGTWSSHDNSPLYRLSISNDQGTWEEWVGHSGYNPNAWSITDNQWQSVEPTEWGQTLLPSIEYSITDWLMPFLYWEHFEYLESGRYRSQAAHRYVFYPPEESAIDIAKVEVLLHAAYKTIVEVTLFNTEGEATKRVDIQSFQKIDDEWIVKQLEFRNELTRDKTRITVEHPRLGLSLKEEDFFPELTK